MSANPVQHQRTKHIEIDIHFVHDMVTAGQVRVLHVPSHFQFADIFTKELPSALFEDFGSSLSVRAPPAPTLSGEQCVNLIRQHGENYDDYFPEELNVLVGKRLLFRFHYTDDHINNYNHVYQVKMLSQDEAMITMFKKYFIVEEPEVDLQTPVPSNANSSRFTNVDSIPFKLDETPKSSYVATKGNASHVDGEHNFMEIESDAGGSGSGK
ncbi:replication protein A 70 kDa DNA-binding subunit B [Tanacetum coccineum]